LARGWHHRNSFFHEAFTSCYFFRNPAENNVMLAENLEADISLAQRVEARVRQSTHGRIRNLVVEEVRGQVTISGQAPSRHAKQLAMQGALELVSGAMFAEKITIG
jgi:hypothetical protein